MTYLSGLSQVALRPFLSETDALEGTNAFNIPPWTILFNDSLTNKQGVVSKGSYVRYKYCFSTWRFGSLTGSLIKKLVF
jgi:hypothetical protein